MRIVLDCSTLDIKTRLFSLEQIEISREARSGRGEGILKSKALVGNLVLSLNIVEFQSGTDAIKRGMSCSVEERSSRLPCYVFFLCMLT